MMVALMVVLMVVQWLLMLLWVRVSESGGGGLLARSGVVGIAVVVAGHGGVIRVCLFPPL